METADRPLKINKSPVRLTLAISLPIILLLGVILGLIYWNDFRSQKTIQENRSLSQLLTLEALFESELDRVTSDLEFLSKHHEIEMVFNSGPSNDIISDFIAFAEVRAAYDQIRIINTEGNEILRVNWAKGQAMNVPSTKLQNKKDRYYFEDSIKLDPGQVYVSQLDLNKERGEVEIPYKPMIRVATPIQVEGQKKGIIILNYLANKILTHLNSDFGDNNKHIMLLNQNGYWLKSSKPQNEWGFMFADKKEVRIQNSFPREWGVMAKKQSGSFYSENGLFTYLTVYPSILTKPSFQYLKTDLQKYWKIVFYLSGIDLEKRSLTLARQLIAVFSLLAVSVFIGSWVLSINIIRRKSTEARIRRQHLANLRFVPREFLRMLNKRNIYDVNLSDCVQKPLTIVFSDIRSYTKISEDLSDQETFHFLNSYFGRVSQQISKHQGFIDKYIGDAIMALFPRSADDALLAAIDMKKSLVSFNEQRVREGKEPIQCGFGVHFGEVTLGTIGIESRMETTAIGDAVNLASRLESITKTYKVCTIVTEDVIQQLKNPDAFNFRKIDTVRVKGKNRAIAIYEVFDIDAEEIILQKRESMPLFKQALDCYEKALFDEAINRFKQCEQISPDDPLLPIYLTRCNTMMRLGAKKDWQGISTI